MGTKVLIVDDSSLIRRLVRTALLGAGFGVVEAADGLETLDTMSTTPDVGLIVCDVNMPNMNGLEFLRALHNGPEANDVPVIMLTTKGQLELLNEAKSLGAKAWLLKPFESDVLVETARRVAHRPHVGGA
jgi:two-component system chemotaxis response regulator CheY